MHRLTMPELRQILRECAGESDTVSEVDDTDVGDIDVDELGYDSLALMEAASRVGRRYGAEIPEEELAEIRTLNAFVDSANRLLETPVPRAPR